MRHKYAIFVRFLNILFDLFVLNISLYFLGTRYVDLLSGLIIFCWFNLIWIISAYLARLYLYKNLIYFREAFIASTKAFIFFIALNTSFNYFFVNYFFVPRITFIKTLLFFFIIFLLSRILFYLLKKYYSLEFYWSKNVITIGDNAIADLLTKQFNNKKELGYIHVLHINESDIIKKNDQELIFTIKKYNVDEVFFINSQINQVNLYHYIKLLDHNSIRVKFVPDFRNFYTKPNNLVLIGDYPVLFLRNEPLESLFNRMTKRLFDIFFSLIIIVFIFSWLFPIIAFLVKLESRGPVLFKQQRSGRDNYPFWCYKFRSMRLNDLSDSKAATRGDSRVTKLGAFMRKTSIDELPQFLNVLLGNMSIVGPRPHMLIHTNQYGNLINQYMVRHFVKPGITGWAQVSGYRGEIQTINDIEGRIEKDVWYIENWSFTLDLQIILLTIYNIFRGEEKAY